MQNVEGAAVDETLASQGGPLWQAKLIEFVLGFCAYCFCERLVVAGVNVDLEAVVRCVAPAAPTCIKARGVARSVLSVVVSHWATL
jgi:hypothetical protein